MDEEKASRVGQVAREMAMLEDATTTLIKKLSELGTRLENICREREPLSVKTEQKQDDEDKVPVALTLHTFSVRVDEAVDRMDSIMERLEL